MLILEQTRNPGPISDPGCRPAAKSSVDLGGESWPNISLDGDGDDDQTEYKTDGDGRLGRRVILQDCSSDDDESKKPRKRVVFGGGLRRTTFRIMIRRGTLRTN